MRWHLLGLTLVAASAMGQTMPEPVTALCTGATLRPALEILSAASKVPMQVGSNMRHEVVAYRFKDVPLGEAMKRLADAVDGQWQVENGIWTLAAHPGRREAQRQAKRQKTLEDIRKQLQAIIDSSKPKKPKPGEEEEPAESRSQTEIELAKAMLALDLRPIADLPPDGRIVYATTPNRMQRAWRLSPQAIRAIVEDHNAAAKVEKEARQNQETETDEAAKKWAEWMQKMGIDPDQNREEITTTPAKALLIVERSSALMSGMGRMTSTCKLYDAKGKVLTTAETYLGSTDFEWGGAIDTVRGGPPQEAPKFDPNSPKLEWSERARALEAFSKTMEQSFMGGTSPELPPLVAEALKDPAKVEPLSIVAGEGLVLAAAAKNLQMVASLPDTAFELGMQGGLEPTADRFAFKVKQQSSLISKEESGWWTIIPKEPIESRAGRCDRTALADLLRSVGPSGMLTLDAAAAYAAKSDGPMRSEIEAGYLMMSSPGLVQLMFGQQEWEALRFYGLLGPGPRKLLEAGQSLPMGGLSPDQRASVSKMVYGAQPRIQIGPPPKEENGIGGLFGMAWSSFGMGGRDKDYRQEPTELCPNGLPGDGSVSMTVKSEFLLKSTKAGMLDFASGGSLDEFATFQLLRENPAMAGGAQIPPVKEVYIGNRRVLNLTFQLAQDAAIRSSLNDDRLDKSGKPVSMDNLPADVKAALDKAMKKVKEMSPFFDPSMMRGRPPIPPANATS